MITNRTYGIDADVISYNARIVAGGNQSLSMQSLRQLNQFVISIKKMKLWNNMVCWPLRANQNAGSGTTAYSLGGLGTYDGTISTTPIWDINGTSFIGDIRNSSIESLVRSIDGYGSILIASNSTTGTINFGILKGGAGNQIADNYIIVTRQYNALTQSQNQLTGGDTTRTFGTLSFSSAGFQFFGASRSGLKSPSTNTGYVKLNSTTNSSLSGSGNLPSTNPYASSFYILGSSFSGNTYAFAMISTPMSATDMENIRILYKTTLGQDLGLP
jgi:hypothetical protein